MKNVFLALLFGLTSLLAFEEITAENFDQKVANKRVIIDFHAPWWGSCKALGKSLQTFQASNKDIVIYKVNRDTQEAVFQRFGVRHIPAMVYFKNGEPQHTEYGVRSPAQIAEKVNKYLK